MGVLCRQFVECVAELRDKNGKIIRCPFARILHDRGGCRSAERQKNASVPAKKIGTRNPCVLLRCRIGQTPQSDVSDAIPQRLPGDLQSVQQTKKPLRSRDKIHLCITATRSVLQTSWSGLRPDTPANASRYAKNSAYREALAGVSGRSPDQDVWSTDRVAVIQRCILSRLRSGFFVC